MPRTTTCAGFRGDSGTVPSRRAVADLLGDAARRRRRLTVRRVGEEARREQGRERRLDELAGKEDAAVTLIAGCRALGGREGRYDAFTLRITVLRQTHA